MQRGRAVLIAIAFISLTGCATHSAARQEKRARETAAHETALRWLKLLDTGNYEEAFEWKAQDFRMWRTQNQLVREMQARRAPFGQTLSRSVIGTASLTKLVGFPDGDYVSVIFKTRFEQKSQTAERVILVKQPAGWRVIDYRIY